jgi:hypothetical protein
MGVTVGGVSLDNLAWNVRTVGGRFGTAGRRGSNISLGGLDGSRWRPKPLAELVQELDMWIVGCNPDGSMPSVVSLQRAVRDRYDLLLRTLAQQHGLTEVVDTLSQRRCYAEVQAPIGPSTMAGATRAEVLVPLVIPAGCWTDVAAVSVPAVVTPSGGPVVLTGLGGGNLPLSGLTVRLTPPGRNIRLTASDGSWVLFSGDLPAGNDTELLLGGSMPDVLQVGSSVSLLGKLTWGRGPVPLVVPVPVDGSDPSLAVVAEAVTAASRISFSGSRRWQSA